MDRAILAVCRERWQKVAMVLVRASEALGTGYEVDDALALRLEMMVADGRLEAIGNVKRWRHSEVRLPREAQPETV